MVFQIHFIFSFYLIDEVNFVSLFYLVNHIILSSQIDWILSNAIKRFPILSENEYDTLTIGADSFIPDGQLIMNESAEVRHFSSKKNVLD